MDIQTEHRRLFEELANLTDDDGALMEMEDIDQLTNLQMHDDSEE